MYAIKETASHFPQMDKALLFKMACNQEDELNSLLSFYRSRLNDFDKERCEWLQGLNEIVSTEAEKHRLHWELQRRRDEIGSLKETLGQFKSNLYQERQSVLQISRENDLLRLKDLEDQKKISELNALVEPVQENIILSKNKKPEVNYAYSKVDGSIHRNKDNFETAIKKVGREGLAEGEAKCVVKNIHLPNDGINQTERENEILRNEIERDREIWIARLDELTAKVQDREARIRDGNKGNGNKIEELRKRSHSLEKRHLDLTKELLQLQIATNEKEQKQQEENELLRLKNTALANKLLIIEKQAEQSNKKSISNATRLSIGAADQFRNQVRSKEENIQIMKEQYNQIQKIYLNKMKQIEEDLTGLTDKYEKLDEKRRVANTSYRSEIKILSNKIDSIKRQIQEYDESQNQN